MTPLHRTLADDVLRFDLEAEKRLVRGELATGQARISRTLVKEGALRVVLIGVSAGGSMREHSADGPVTIFVLEGEIVLEAGGKTQALETGALVALDAGVRHAVSAPRGGLFLLTLAAAGRPLAH